MAQITINVADEHIARVRQAFCAYHGYQDKLPDGTDNPETRIQFMKRKIKEYVKNSVTAHEADAAALAARQQVILDVELLSID